MNHRSTVLFTGCRDRREAEARLRGWVAQILADDLRVLETNVLLRNDTIDLDDFDAELEERLNMHARAIDDLVAQFHDTMDRLFDAEAQR